MGWLKDQVVKLFNWLADKIFRPVIKWITDTINTIVTELKIAAAVILGQIAEWLENDFFFVGAVLAAIAGMVFAPQIAAYLKTVKAGILASALVKFIKDISSIIKLEEILTNLETVNALFKLFWPKYQDLMESFSDALSGAAELFGEGTGLLHSYLNLARSLAINTCALIGLDADAAEVMAYQNMAEWSKKLENRIARYMRNPGLIMKDLITEVFIPMSEENMISQGALVEDVRSNFDQLEVQLKAAQSLTKDVDEFIQSLPEEIRAEVDGRWKDFYSDVQEALDFIEEEVFTKIDATIDIFELRVVRAEQIAEVVEAKLDDPLTVIGTGFLYGDDYLHDYQDAIRALVDGSEDREYDSFANAFETMMEKLDLSGHIPEDLFEPPPSMVFEPAGIKGGSTEQLSINRDWFVGEY